MLTDMSFKQFVATTGLLIILLSSILWRVNGWNATNGIMYILAATLIVGAGVAWYAEHDD